MCSEGAHEHIVVVYAVLDADPFPCNGIIATLIGRMLAYGLLDDVDSNHCDIPQHPAGFSAFFMNIPDKGALETLCRHGSLQQQRKQVQPALSQRLQSGWGPGHDGMDKNESFICQVDDEVMIDVMRTHS